MNFPGHPNRSLPKHLDKILFALACGYLLVVLWCLVRQDSSLKQPVTQKPQNSAKDTQFIAYLLRSLKVIEDRAANPQVPTQTSPLQPLAETVLPNQQPKGQQKELPKISVKLNREETEVSNLVPPPPPLPLPIPSPPPLPLATSKPPSPSPSLTNVPSLPKAPVSSPQARLSPQTVPTPQVSNTLVGLLELGDNSAALFNINGITKKIQVGEVIGNSGWWIVSIANQQLIVQRNGEVRSVYVGQQL